MKLSAALFLLAIPASADEVIRCPDWESLVASDRSTVVRTSATPAQNFEDTLARTRATLDAATGAPLDGANLRGQSGPVTTGESIEFYCRMRASI